MGTGGLFISAWNDQVKFLQLTPGSILWPHAKHSCSRAGTHREVIDEGIAVSSGSHTEHTAEVPGGDACLG